MFQTPQHCPRTRGRNECGCGRQHLSSRVGICKVFFPRVFLGGARGVQTLDTITLGHTRRTVNLIAPPTRHLWGRGFVR